MEYQRIRIEFKNSIALLTLNHPQTLNAVSLQMIRELNRVLDEIEDPSRDARCLLITGRGRGFCAGFGNPLEQRRHEGLCSSGPESTLEVHDVIPRPLRRFA